MAPEMGAAAEVHADTGMSAGTGALVANEAGAAGVLPSTVPSAQWAFSVRPVAGWGAPAERQKATAGWLAALPVFEPHWQARASEPLVWAVVGHFQLAGHLTNRSGFACDALVSLLWHASCLVLLLIKEIQPEGGQHKGCHWESVAL